MSGRDTRARPALVLALVLAAGCGGSGERGPADPRGAKVERLEIRSRAVGRALPVTLVTPAGARRARPLLVFLHGRGSDERSYLSDELYAALARLGARAPVVALPDGGDASYWHDRRDGAWGRYVVDEVVPQVARRARTARRRVAIGGISMGGFGALDLARRHPGRFCAVGAHSPALWREAGETAEGAFDDAADFERHDVVGAARATPGAFGGAPLWLDAGDEDPFLPGFEALRDGLRAGGIAVRGAVWPGGHDGAYWSRHWDDYLGFYADACPTRLPGT